MLIKKVKNRLLQEIVAIKTLFINDLNLNIKVSKKKSDLS